MAWTLESTWQPTQLLQVAESFGTSTGATEVNTDAGRAYGKRNWIDKAAPWFGGTGRGNNG